jgi:hypothetical protein
MGEQVYRAPHLCWNNYAQVDFQAQLELHPLPSPCLVQIEVRLNPVPTDEQRSQRVQTSVSMFHRALWGSKTQAFQPEMQWQKAKELVMPLEQVSQAAFPSAQKIMGILFGIYAQ